jgi:Mor family transcriptional regulator
MQPLPYEVPPEGTPDAKQLESVLPQSLKKLRTRLSLETVIRLVENYGGSQVYIPKTMVENSKLAQVIGPEAAQALSEVVVKGERLDVPRALRFKTHLRNREIVRRSDLGENASSLARHFQLTQRQIFKVLEDFR